MTVKIEIEDYESDAYNQFLQFVYNNMQKSKELSCSGAPKANYAFDIKFSGVLVNSINSDRICDSLNTNPFQAEFHTSPRYSIELLADHIDIAPPEKEALKLLNTSSQEKVSFGNEIVW